MDFEVMRQHQASSLERISQIIENAEREIAGIDPQLRDEIVRERAQQIREHATAALSEERRAIQRRAGDAELAERKHEPAALRRHARFAEEPLADATIRLATFGSVNSCAAVPIHPVGFLRRGRWAWSRPRRPPDMRLTFNRHTLWAQLTTAKTLTSVKARAQWCWLACDAC